MNREYKDSVFTTLFGNKEKLIELYNAVQGTDYGLDAELEINTLEGALYTQRQNDISFLLNGRFVVLVEHQSTINENMPVRMLLYAGRLYEKLLNNREMYYRSLLPIPAPEFIVLYNGMEPYPGEKTLKLSDAFIGVPHDNTMELKVKVVNVNTGGNQEILSRSETLREYGEFVEKVRQMLKKRPPDEAFTAAIEECIQKGILVSFLKEHGSEVHNMLYREWKLEEALEVSMLEGEKKGEQKKNREIIRALHEKGMTIDFIAEVAKLPRDEVERYLN